MEQIEVDVALLPVSGTFVMTADEAAGACSSVTAGIVVPMHYNKVVGTRDDALKLFSLCGATVSILPNENR
jgi:L-ascorbate metabolism protein UlaG (beta-lactamase superfamily)